MNLGGFLTPPLALARIFRSPALAGVFVCLLLVGCASPQLRQLQLSTQRMVPLRAQIANVPFVPQDDYQCGPAALAMVAGHAGVQQSLANWVEQVYLPARQGSLQPEMLAASRRAGLPAYVIAPRLQDLLREVAAGHPVLVLQNLSLPVSPLWHYAVVVGYDLQTEQIVLHSARSQSLSMSISAFERTWARSGHWAMLALPPTQLPVTAQPDAFVASVAALERVRAQDAHTAYQTALQAWPTQRLALLGLGNSAYAQKRLQDATAAYRRATQTHPDFADAWNNLAQVLHEQNQHSEALSAAQQAVQLGGPRLAQYEALAQRLQAQMGR